MKVVISISSFICEGKAGLKIFQEILQDKLIPVPCAIYSTYASRPECVNNSSKLEDLLQGIIASIKPQGIKVVLHVGFLHTTDQHKHIISFIEQLREQLEVIIIDPVCGDHGKLYIASKLLPSWIALLEYADIAFPNAFEYQTLCDQGIKEWPPTTVITSYSNKAFFGLKIIKNNEIQEIGHELIAGTIGGTGDTLVAQFIKAHYLLAYDFEESLHMAIEATLKFIKNSTQSQYQL